MKSVEERECMDGRLVKRESKGSAWMGTYWKEDVEKKVYGFEKLLEGER